MPGGLSDTTFLCREAECARTTLHGRVGIGLWLPGPEPPCRQLVDNELQTLRMFVVTENGLQVLHPLENSLRRRMSLLSSEAWGGSQDQTRTLAVPGKGMGVWGQATVSVSTIW
jgi:hypothetical protein